MRRGRSAAFNGIANDAGGSGEKGRAPPPLSLNDFSPVNAVKGESELRIFPVWAGPVSAILLGIFFYITLTDLVPFGKDVKPYFEHPTAPDGLLAKQFKIDTDWKFVLLFFGMCFLNMLGYIIQTQYVAWRWTFVVKPSDDEGFAPSLGGLALYSACCIIIELFLTTINIVNLLVSFTNYVMLFQIALAHGAVIFIWAWMAKRRKERKMWEEKGNGVEGSSAGGLDKPFSILPLPENQDHRSATAGGWRR